MPTKISSFKGVSFDDRRQNWKAQIVIRTTRHLGRYAEEEAAARAYDNARYFLDSYLPHPTKTGDLNFPFNANSTGPSDATEALRKQLIEERAPEYRHLDLNSPAGHPEALRADQVLELERLFLELTRLDREAAQTKVKIGNLIQSLKLPASASPLVPEDTQEDVGE
jgi:hypothetical protein